MTFIFTTVQYFSDYLIVVTKLWIQVIIWIYNWCDKHVDHNTYSRTFFYQIITNNWLFLCKRMHWKNTTTNDKIKLNGTEYNNSWQLQFTMLQKMMTMSTETNHNKLPLNNCNYIHNYYSCGRWRRFNSAIL